MWRKSSYSGLSMSCAEVNWRKSSRSSGQSAACVEVALAEGVKVRDSKCTEGGQLVFSSSSWAAFVSSLA